LLNIEKLFFLSETPVQKLYGIFVMKKGTRLKAEGCRSERGELRLTTKRWIVGEKVGLPNRGKERGMVRKRVSRYSVLEHRAKGKGHRA
jgi:putative ribosome biogenesis GTPase RsgA